MSEMITDPGLFRLKASKAETKADMTNQAAKAIIDAEAQRRDAKTARLRQARLEQEATVVEDVKPAKARRAKAPAKAGM